MERANRYFPDIQNDDVKIWMTEVMDQMKDISRVLLDIQFYASFFAGIVTLFHLVILTRKFMAKCSITSVMIGIAVFDFVTVFSSVASGNALDDEGTLCDPPMSLLFHQRFWIFNIIRDFSRRNSTWLGVMMTFIRVVGIKFTGNLKYRKFSDYKCGFYFVLASSAVSSLLSITFYFRYNYTETSIWKPDPSCKNIDLSITYPVFKQTLSSLFAKKFGKMFMLVNGIITRIVPCILLPMFTILLILEIRRVGKIRKFQKSKLRRKSERTSGLVIFMAVSFFIYELPVGLFQSIQVVFDESGFRAIAGYVLYICNLIYTGDVVSHCVICFLMSSDYRKTARLLLSGKATS